MRKAFAKLLIALCLFASATEGLETLVSNSHEHGSDSGYFIKHSQEHASVFDDAHQIPNDVNDCQEETHSCHLGHCGTLSNTGSQIAGPRSYESLRHSDDSLLKSAYLDMAGDPPRGRS